jgi:hypothetical protein
VTVVLAIGSPESELVSVPETVLVCAVAVRGAASAKTIRMANISVALMKAPRRAP